MEELIMLEECPVCRGAGLIMHEGGWSVQVECADCSAHTIYMEYNNEEEKKEAERAVVHIFQPVFNSAGYGYSPRSLVTTLPMFQRCTTARSASFFSSSLLYSM